MDKQINKERDRQANRYIQSMLEFRILNNMRSEVLMTVNIKIMAFSDVISGRWVLPKQCTYLPDYTASHLREL
jgi:hypothetical protein